MSATRISKRVQGFTESVIREMTRVVSEVGGVNLAQGMPNFPPPPELIAAAHRAIDGDFHQYSITWGTPRLRRAIADKYSKWYGMQVDPAAAGNGGAHRDDLGDLEVVLGDGLADRVRDRSRGSQHRHPAGPRLRHRRCAPPAAGSRGARARAARLVLRAPARAVPGPAGPSLWLR